MLTKNELRQKARNIRNSLDMDDLSRKITANIRELDAYKKAKHIMIFYPLKHEVNLLWLLDDNKQFYLPKVIGKDMAVCPYKSGDELTLSEFKTKEPTSAPVNSSIIDIVFVPALMVDENNNRLGYGGGFYDIFLSKYALNAKKITAIPSILKASKLPSENFDAVLDIIITELKH